MLGAGHHHELARARPPNPNPSGVAGRQSILIVDDDLGTCEAFEVILSAAGFRLSRAVSAAETLAILKVIAFDLVLLDLWLGEIKAFPLLEHIRRMERSPPVVMISGFGDVVSTANAFKLGAVDFVEKPLFEEKLIDVVTRNLVRKPGLDETGLADLLRAFTDCRLDVEVFCAVAEAVRCVVVAGASSDARRPNASPRLDTWQPRDWRILSLLSSFDSRADDADILQMDEAMWAARFRCSASHLGRLIMKELGLDFPDLRRVFRLKRASYLLAIGRSSGQAAHASGFSDPSQFTREFHAFFGMLPSDFRAKLRARL